MPAPIGRVAAIAALTAAVFAPSLHAAQPNPDRYIVKFQPGAAGAARAALARAAARVALEMPSEDAVAVELPRGALVALQRNPNIEYIERDVPRYALALATPSTGSPYQAGQRVPYGVTKVQADQLTAVNAGSRKVCVIDSGYDAAHEDLASSADVTGEYDSGTGWWHTDENSHGTHVAGTIAALNNNKGVVGVVSNGSLKLHIVKVFGADGWAYSSTLTAAAEKCREARANVISMSLGGSFSSRTEKQKFDQLYALGILSVAAAGNDGNTRQSYPASYDSVMSVAAVDVNDQWATFSQYNKQVEIAAPGVQVLSTVPMGTGREAATAVNGVGYASLPMEGTPVKSGSGSLVDCGLGTSVCAAAGKVCLIQRGTISFAEKVLNCQAGGGNAAIIYNNVAGELNGTLGDTATAIPSVGVTAADGAAMKNSLGTAASVAVSASNYAYFDGTSMATPHVSAAAALAWSARTTCTAAQVRKALTATAIDLGARGRDTKTGWGLVQAKAARDYLTGLGC